MKVFITGIGAVSAIGMDVSQMLESLVAEKHGIGRVSILETAHADTLPCGEIKITDEEFIQRLGIPPDRKINRTTLLAITAVQEALASSGGKISDPLRTGLISSTTVGGMTTTEKYFYDFDSVPETRDWIEKLDCGDSTNDIAKYIGHRGFMTTLSTACSSSANAIILGANMIKAGLLDRVICGGADALSKFTINGFNSLMLLEQEHCRPFDKERKGLNLGEGAGFVVIESERAVEEYQRTPLAEVAGYSNVNDAFHQTASSPDGAGAQMAMKNAMLMAGVSPADIDYINVHGTGTPNNDESESKAIKAIFEKAPSFSSTKAYTGHTLAAAGGIEAVISVLAIRNRLLFPNLNYKNRMDDIDFDPVTQLVENADIRHVISNSFGFGGNNTSLLFRKV
ncbi:MAG: beta-ketoacyl-[acyl-carrier-protein] synthase family protein [Flavobacteriales bacterium]|nr:beta-ketoacyl-[acyl-carrier-protein] synthase family protein [Flavobacteriales bacterium]